MKIVKKLFKYLGYTFLVLLILIILIPIIFGKQIKEAIRNYVNDQINAEVYFGDIGLSVFKNFPNVTASLNDFGVVGINEFKGDTLVDVNQLRVTVDLWSVLFGEEYVVRQVGLQDPTINVKVLANGKPSYEIWKTEEETTAVADTAAADTSGSGLALQLSKYWIENGNIVYDDHYLHLFASITNLNHSGSGEFDDDNYDFDTETTAEKVTVRMDGTNYLSDAALDFDVTVNIDNANSTYTLKDNSFAINDLVLGLDGYVSMPGENIHMDLKFDTKKNTFSNILSMVPGMYSPDFGDMKTDGTFTLNGDVKGKYSETTLPGFNVNMGVVGGYFQYPDLPESVKDINFDLKVNCPDGNIDNIKINFPKFHCLFGEAPIDASLKLAGVTSENMDIDAKVKANLDLANLLKMFPMEGQDLKGKFMVDATAKGKYNTSGNTFPKVNAKMSLQNGYYKTVDFPSAIENMSMQGTMINEDGSLEKTFIDVTQFHAEIDGEPIDATLKASNMANVNYDLTAKGKLDLAKLNKIYPIEGTEMAGLINLDLQTKGTYDDIMAERYTKLPTSGSMKITNLVYKSTDFPQGMKVTNSDVSFTPQKMNITAFNGSVGRSPINITGYLDNYLAYALLPDENLSGVMTLTSAFFDVNEWLVEEGETAPAPSAEAAPAADVPMEVYPVPANIDFVFNATIKKVFYDNLTLNNLRGKVIMRDQAVKFENLEFNALDGSFRMSGAYDTKNIAKPAYDMNFNLAGLNIQKTFEAFAMVQTLVPAAKFVNGNFNSNFTLKGLLKGDMMPDLATLTSIGRMTVVNGKVSNMPVMNTVAEKVKVNTLKAFDIADTKIFFEVRDGRLWIEPFDMKIGNVDLTSAGSNGLDGTIDYDMDMSFPAGKIGSAAVNALSGITGKSVGSNEDIQVKLGLGGTALKPKITRINSSATDGVQDAVNDKIDDAKEQVEEKVEEVKEQVEEKVEEVKEQVQDKIDDAKEKAKAEAAKIMAEAEKQAADIRKKGKEAADKVRAEAEANAKKIEAEARNPIEKKAKEKLADQTRKKGEEAAKKIEQESDQRAKNVMDAARARADKLLAQ